MRTLSVALGLLLFSAAPAHAGTRLKDLVDLPGARDNALFGYGLVVGLPGTGDTESVFFTSQTVSAVLGRLGIRVDPSQVRARNVAAVMVTANLPSYARPGTRIDVTVSSLGNARALLGGTLLLTPLSAADGAVYAVAQGPLQTGGYAASGLSAQVSKNATTSARVPQGATVERAVSPALPQGKLLLQLKRPDFTNAARVAQAVTLALGPGTARALDPAAVEVTVPDALQGDPVGLVAKVEALEVEVDVRAKVVVSERTGTVVAGGAVRLRPAVVAHGALRVSIQETPAVSQPGPFARGSTVPGTVTNTQVDEPRAELTALPSTTTVQELVAALQSLGASTQDLISILQALKAAGALDADLEVQ